MKIIRSINNKSIYYSIILTILVIYSPFFFRDLFMIDDSIIIDPLKKISTLDDYVLALKKGLIIDFQPIRDASHIFDIYIDKLFHFNYMGLISNIVILILTSLYLFKILNQQNKNTVSNHFYLLFFLVHPAIFFIYIEPTSRKHILSFLFILITYYYYLTDFKTLGKKSKMILFFILSCLSQPINFLFPCFLLTNSFFAQKKDLKYNLIQLKELFIITFIIGLLNLIYYRVIYTQIIGVPRVMSVFGLFDHLMIIGMFFRQLLMPFTYSPFYATTSIQNLMGLLAFPIFLLFFFKKNKKYTLYFLVLFSITFFILYGQGSYVNYLNTYLLTPFLGIILLYSQVFVIKKYRLFLLLFIPLSLTLFYASKRANKLEFHEHIEILESSCRNRQMLITLYLKKGNSDKLNYYGKKWLEQRCLVMNPKDHHVPTVINTFLILHNKELTHKEKMNLFKYRLKDQNDLIYLEAYLLKDEDGHKLLDSLDDSVDASIFISPEFHLGDDLKKLCRDKENIGCKKLLRILLSTQDKSKLYRFSTKNR